MRAMLVMARATSLLGQRPLLQSLAAIIVTAERGWVQRDMLVWRGSEADWMKAVDILMFRCTVRASALITR